MLYNHVRKLDYVLILNKTNDNIEIIYASVKSGLIVTSHIDNTDIFFCSRQSETNVHISNALN